MYCVSYANPLWTSKAREVRNAGNTDGYRGIYAGLFSEGHKLDSFGGVATQLSEIRVSKYGLSIEIQNLRVQ